MKSNQDTLKSLIGFLNPQALIINEFDEALVGYTKSPVIVAVYDRQKCLDVLVKREGMSYEDAEEYFSGHTENIHAGSQSPMFVEFFPVIH